MRRQRWRGRRTDLQDAVAAQDAGLLRGALGHGRLHLPPPRPAPPRTHGIACWAHLRVNVHAITSETVNLSRKCKESRIPVLSRGVKLEANHGWIARHSGEGNGG